MIEYTGNVEVIPYMSKKKIVCDECQQKVGMVYLTTRQRRNCAKCRKKHFIKETGNWQ